MTDFDAETLKKLAIYLEYNAREKYPEMDGEYKTEITSFFNKIKGLLKENNKTPIKNIFDSWIKLII